MIGDLKATSQFSSIPKLGAAAALLSTMILAVPNTAQAGSANDEMVNGQYCNSLCKAYMSWSDRMLAITQPHARPQVRVALPQQSMTPKKMVKVETTDRAEPRAQHAPKSHRPTNLDSFAQLPAASHAAQSAMDDGRSDETPAEYAAARLGRLYGTDPAPPRSALAEMRRATAETADMRLVSMTEPGLSQGAMTVGEASGSTRSKMPSIWIMLAAVALLAFFGHGWLKRRADADHGIN
ncbi:hypothetical protein HL666_21025 [Bradyrhizobium sp. 83002]|uniref:hypothetical protein n=1 Tax=Bradyrhizobium aeschynomenes TaxID=2734909 RepID=UPI001554636F|nr:hypothetical protein [Bradyrhizobium aeschynomenes]NPU13252.1 hypothetical protein [Bradyrhizobium aeschynomenes]NPV20259.1 hypothetical protein [Bradyrhizobium aeschynomenes]